MLKAKSIGVAPLGRDFNSPLGVNTKISLEYRLSLNSSTKSTAFALEFSSASCNLFSHISIPCSCCWPCLYLKCAAYPFSAISCIRSLRICTSTHLPLGPITVMCKASYPVDFGEEIQSRSRTGFGVKWSVTMEYIFHARNFSSFLSAL